MTKGLSNLITAWHATMASPGRWGHQEKSQLILQYWRMIDWAKQLVTLLLIDLIRLILVTVSAVQHSVTSMASTFQS